MGNLAPVGWRHPPSLLVQGMDLLMLERTLEFAANSSRATEGLARKSRGNLPEARCQCQIDEGSPGSPPVAPEETVDVEEREETK